MATMETTHPLSNRGFKALKRLGTGGVRAGYFHRDAVGKPSDPSPVGRALFGGWTGPWTREFLNRSIR